MKDYLHVPIIETRRNHREHPDLEWHIDDLSKAILNSKDTVTYEKLACNTCIIHMMEVGNNRPMVNPECLIIIMLIQVAEAVKHFAQSKQLK